VWSADDIRCSSFELYTEFVAGQPEPESGESIYACCFEVYKATDFKILESFSMTDRARSNVLPFVNEIPEQFGESDGDPWTRGVKIFSFYFKPGEHTITIAGLYHCWPYIWSEELQHEVPAPCGLSFSGGKKDGSSKESNVVTGVGFQHYASGGLGFSCTLDYSTLPDWDSCAQYNLTLDVGGSPFGAISGVSVTVA
jgi:hypothetical protein